MNDALEAEAPVVVLETDRLRLREITRGDAQFLARLLNEPSFLRFIGDRGVRSTADAEHYIETGPRASYVRHGFGLWLVERREDERAIGSCGLLQRETLPDPDVGFALLPEYWSRGYATEAATAVLRYGAEQLGLGRIVAVTSPENVASIAVLEKLGLTREGRVLLAGNGDAVLLFGPVGRPPSRTFERRTCVERKGSGR